MAGFLTVEEKKGLEEALRVERYARYSDRIKCILLLDAGDPPEEIAHYLFLSLSTITNYMRRYYDGGLTGLIQDRYMGSECRLSEDELVEFVQHLEDNLYLTISAIRDYVLSKYQVLYTVSGLRHLLNRLGFVYKKPKAIPGKASRDLQAEFLSILDERLQENSDSIAVFFADGTHPQHNTHCAYGWIKKGVNKEIKTNTGRKRVNINGAINAKDPTEVVIVESASIDALSTIRLLKNLEELRSDLDKIYLVVDNARLTFPAFLDSSPSLIYQHKFVQTHLDYNTQWMNVSL